MASRDAAGGLAHCTPAISVVVCPPELGDEVQGMKAGILEIADVLVVSKADLPAANPPSGSWRRLWP